MEATLSQHQCSVTKNPENLLQQLRLEEQGIYDSSWNVKYREYLTRFNEITWKVVWECFDILEKKENSFSWFSTVVSRVVDKIINNEQLNPLSINTLPHDILHEEFLSRSYELIDLAPEKQDIIFEIVEKHFGSLEDAKVIAEKLKILQNRWVKIAIDDIFISHHTIEDKPSQWLENLQLLLNYGLIPNIIKIDWDRMETLYGNRNNPLYQELLREYQIQLSEFRKIVGPDCIIVAERVNTHEEIAFAKSLWCCGFQWFKLKELFSK